MTTWSATQFVNAENEKWNRSGDLFMISSL